ncbi:MAG TPA: sigma-70 family RNA polymerase sigma factor [Rhodocyclaceae bacterium]|nr:sigma-70 family RNA polymerase sigma factor [Rhodocyclaceae bacterium]
MAVDEDFNYEAALSACASGDEQALQGLYKQESRRLLGVVLRIVRDKQIAEDVVHDTFVSIWTKAATFDFERGSGRGWIYSIARHRALSLVRKDLRNVSVDEETLEALEADGQFEASTQLAEAFEMNADLGQLQGCLDRLDTPKRNSILFAYVDGCSHSEIAERVKAPLGTVKAWIRRGIASLRECLG